MKFLAGIALIITSLTALVYVWFLKPAQTTYEFKLDQAAVVKQVKQLGRLETTSFTIEKIVEGVQDAEGTINYYLYSDRLLLVAHGEIIGGTDVSQLKAADIEINGSNITMKLPPTTILFSRLDNNKTHVYSRDQSALSGVNKDLESKTRLAAESAIVTAACEAKILEDAADKAEKQMTLLLQLLGFRNVTIEVSPGTCQAPPLPSDK